MAASSPKPPLFLFQVLEDEYAALHGELPAHVDWQFRASHIIYAESLIARLDLTSPAAHPDQAPPRKTRRPRPQIKPTADPDEVAKNALIKYLRDELARKNFTSSASGAGRACGPAARSRPSRDQGPAADAHRGARRRMAVLRERRGEAAPGAHPVGLVALHGGGARALLPVREARTAPVDRGRAERLRTLLTVAHRRRGGRAR